MFLWQALNENACGLPASYDGDAVDHDHGRVDGKMMVLLWFWSKGQCVEPSAVSDHLVESPD